MEKEKYLTVQTLSSILKKSVPSVIKACESCQFDVQGMEYRDIFWKAKLSDVKNYFAGGKGW